MERTKGGGKGQKKKLGPGKSLLHLRNWRDPPRKGYKTAGERLNRKITSRRGRNPVGKGKKDV